MLKTVDWLSPVLSCWRGFFFQNDLLATQAVPALPFSQAFLALYKKNMWLVNKRQLKSCYFYCSLPQPYDRNQFNLFDYVIIVYMSIYLSTDECYWIWEHLTHKGHEQNCTNRKNSSAHNKTLECRTNQKTK